MLKTYLKEKNIDFVDKEVDVNDAAREEMMKISGGFLGVPYVVIDNNGAQEKIIGFDKKRINTILEIHK